MHFANLCADLAIPGDEIASVLGVEQHLADAIDGGKAEVANRSSADRSLENAVQRLRAKAIKPVNENDVLRAIHGDRRDNANAPLPAELAKWQRDANEEFESNKDNALECLAKQRVPVGLGSPREDLRAWIVDGLKKKGALVDSSMGSVGPIRLVGYAVKVPPPVRS